ncbi:MAG: hypothetical protein J6P16_06240 [Eubacterium sp.]|nr:hypothetical protein [Eubacterium sp.]
MDELERQAKNTREKYADIIDLERPISKRKKMSIEDRAAQFAPFAALTGYHESVEQTEGEYSLAHETGGVETETFYD